MWALNLCASSWRGFDNRGICIYIYICGRDLLGLFHGPPCRKHEAVGNKNIGKITITTNNYSTSSMYLITIRSISIILSITSMHTINNIHSINGISNINSAIRLHSFNSFLSFNHFSVGKSISPSSYEERAQAAFDSVEVLWDEKKSLQGTGASTSLKITAYL